MSSRAKIESVARAVVDEIKAGVAGWEFPADGWDTLGELLGGRDAREFVRGVAECRMRGPEVSAVIAEVNRHLASDSWEQWIERNHRAEVNAELAAEEVL